MTIAEMVDIGFLIYFGIKLFKNQMDKFDWLVVFIFVCFSIFNDNTSLPSNYFNQIYRSFWAGMECSENENDNAFFCMSHETDANEAKEDGIKFGIRCGKNGLLVKATPYNNLECRTSIMTNPDPKLYSNPDNSNVPLPNIPDIPVPKLN